MIYIFISAWLVLNKMHAILLSRSYKMYLLKVLDGFHLSLQLTPFLRSSSVFLTSPCRGSVKLVEREGEGGAKKKAGTRHPSLLECEG